MKAKLTFFLLVPIVLFCSNNLQAQVINTFAGTGFGAGTGTGGYTGDGGPCNLAELNSCTGVTFDGAGNIYIADKSNNVVRKIDLSGYISTFAGNDTAGYSGDGGLANHAKLNNPHNVAADIWGNIYISDYGNNVVRKVNGAGVITTIAGTGTAGYTGDYGPATAATLNGPQGLIYDNHHERLYVADANNNVVRVIYSNDTIATFAGTGVAGYSGNGGQAAYAQMHLPADVTIDIYGNLYIADYLNNVVRIVDTFGKIRNFAGNTTPGSGGDGGAAASAQLHYPSGVSIYEFGDVYIADQANSKIRKVNTAGKISTYAGSGTNGYHGDGGAAVSAELSSPKGVSVDALGRLFVADYDNNVIRIITTTTNVRPVAAPGECNIYPNPSNGAFSVEIPAMQESSEVSVTDMLGRVVQSKNITGQMQQQTLHFTGIPAGSYIVKVKAGDKNFREKVVVW